MKAVAYTTSLPIADPNALLDIELPTPQFGEHDLLVEVKAISVNPVDTKVRRNRSPQEGAPVVLGWDAAGIVREIGSAVRLFKPGDRVWYAGNLLRPGTNAELHAVDERIVGPMPHSLDFAAAAAMPLTTLTAWELLFDRLQIPQHPDASGASLLVMGAAGGVGSILVQLARQLTDLTVIGTASRPESQAWLRELGAHHVVDHGKPLPDQLAQLARQPGIPPVRYIAALTHSDQHFDAMAEVVAPQGRIAMIDDPATLDVRKLKTKSVSLHWEFMYTRSMYSTDDQIRQHEILARVAQPIDNRTLRSTASENFGTINAANLKRAHALLESNQSRGKIVLEGF